MLISQIFLLSITAYQDFKDRAISWFLPFLLFGLGFCVKFWQTDLNWREMLALLSFIILQLSILYIILAFRYKTLKIKLTSNFLGWGDILFFIAMIPFFGFEEYIILFVLGLGFSLIGHQLIVKKLNTKSIPLAGWLSVFYGIYFIVTY